MFKNILSFIAERLTERSTWVGLIGLATAAGAVVSPDTANAIITVGMTVAGAVGVLTKD